MEAPATRHVVDAATSPLAVPPRQRRELGAAIDRAVRGRRRIEARLVAISWPLPEPVDPAEVAFASRLPGEPWICFEQPERERSAFAGLGAAATLEDRGPGRFERVAARWRELVAEAYVEPSGGPFGSGLVAAGGFAFAGDGSSSVHWSAFAPASLVVPEVAFARRDDETWCTVAALARPRIDRKDSTRLKNGVRDD